MRESQGSSCHERLQWVEVCQWISGSSLDTRSVDVLILDFLPSRNVGNRRALFINHPVSSIFLWKPRWTKTLLQLICRKQSLSDIIFFLRFAHGQMSLFHLHIGFVIWLDACFKFWRLRSLRTLCPLCVLGGNWVPIFIVFALWYVYLILFPITYLIFSSSF